MDALLALLDRFEIERLAGLVRQLHAHDELVIVLVEQPSPGPGNLLHALGDHVAVRIGDRRAQRTLHGLQLPTGLGLRLDPRDALRDPDAQGEHRRAIAPMRHAHDHLVIAVGRGLLGFERDMGERNARQQQRRGERNARHTNSMNHGSLRLPGLWVDGP